MTNISTQNDPVTLKKWPLGAEFARPAGLFLLIVCFFYCFSNTALAWTLSDLHPKRILRDKNIFSLTRADPIGVRVIVIPVIDDPVNAPVYARLSGEFSNALRSFANEVWLVTDLPDNPIKQGFFAAITHINADYKLKNRLSMDLLGQMIPDFECDFIALFEVTDYNRFWIDHDLQYRVGARAVFYDYNTGEPRIEKYYEGGRGRRYEEGAFNEAERSAIKGLVEELERPLRDAIRAREIELKKRYKEIGMLASKTGDRELAIHQHDLALMQRQVTEAVTKARAAEMEKQERERQVDQLQSELKKLQDLLAKENEPDVLESGVAQSEPIPLEILNIPPPRMGKGRALIPTIRTEDEDAFEFEWDNGLKEEWEYVGPDPGVE